MNRAFLIILAPAALVAAAFLGLGWGYTVSLPAGLVVLALASGAFLLRRRKVRLAADRSGQLAGR
jgi:membrane protein implicated in regulation of membrane protease activity